MSNIFINYRTDDEEGTATLIDRELSDRFGSANVFKASRSISPGDNFEKVLLRKVRRCDVLLAIIGPRWLTARDGKGRRKIDLESDWTRREILEALDCESRVIPVLVGSTKRLSAAALPAELAELASCQYVRFNHRSAARDIGALAATLTELVPELRDRRSAPKAKVPRQANYASGNAHIGIQGTVNGDVHFPREEKP